VGSVCFVSWLLNLDCGVDAGIVWFWAAWKEQSMACDGIILTASLPCASPARLHDLVI